MELCSRVLHHELWFAVALFNVLNIFFAFQVQAVRYIIFTISMRAKQMISRFTQMHADKNTVALHCAAATAA